MKIKLNEPPRKYRSGTEDRLEISDQGKIFLDPYEMVTLVGRDGKEHEVTAMPWGFYATPSVNARVKTNGFKTALTRDYRGRYYVILVLPEKLSEFEAYLIEQQSEVVEWLDTREAQ